MKTQQLELFETKTKDAREVYMGVYCYKDESPKTTPEMCIFIGKKQTLWFGRDQMEASILGCAEYGTNMIDLDYKPYLVFGVCGYPNQKYGFKEPMWYFKDQTNNTIVMSGRALKPDNMLREISKLKHSITGL